MAITDLTNTTWYVPSGWTATAGYGSFYDLEFTISTLPDVKLSHLDIGYTFDFNEEPPYSYTANVISSNTNAQIIAENGEEFTLYFSYYGTEFPDLIQWLTDNNAVQLKVTDLTDTTWKIYANGGSEEPEPRSEDLILNGIITFPDGEQYSFTKIEFADDYKAAFYNGNNHVFSYDSLDNAFVNTSYDDAPEGDYFINCQGGTDIKNPALIAWFSKYGELQVEEETTYTLSGAWRWNEDADMEHDIPSQDINFTSNGETFVRMEEQVDQFSYVRADGTYAMIWDDTPQWKEEYMVFDFGSTPQTVSEEYYNAVTSNATPQEEEGEEEPEEPDTPETTTPHGEIYYKGNLVATLVEGETIVLHAKDFKFLGDIVIKNVGEAEEETPTGYTIDFSGLSVDGNGDTSTLTIYDGQDANGTIVYQETNNSVFTLTSYQFTSGYFYITWESNLASSFAKVTATGGVTITSYSTSAATLTFAQGTVTADGAISGQLWGDD